MTFVQIITFAVLIWAVSPASLSAQSFSSGSDGSFGEIKITSGTQTLSLPPDGSFHATTVTVAKDATLLFQKNALNTPVFLLATGDIVIEGTVDVSGSPGGRFSGGQGGPGGFDGGAPGVVEALAGDGGGPGAGLRVSVLSDGGNAAYGAPFQTSNATNGRPYGSSLLVPLIGGSGGGGGQIISGTTVGGSGGGGAILLASTTRVHIPFPGQVAAFGGLCNSAGCGSGGAIRIVAPTVSGNGRLFVLGGSVNKQENTTTGGPGRIRIETLRREQLAFQVVPLSAAASIGGFLFTGLPSFLPRLDIIKVAGTEIPEGTQQDARIILPFNTPTRQTVTVQAKGFASAVPINVVLTPEFGSRTVIPAEIPASGGNPAQVTIDVDFAVNVLTRVNVYTRQ